jgi:hypothetical protein
MSQGHLILIKSTVIIDERCHFQFSILIISAYKYNFAISVDICLCTLLSAHIHVFFLLLPDSKKAGKLCFKGKDNNKFYTIFQLYYEKL